MKHIIQTTDATVLRNTIISHIEKKKVEIA